MLAAVPVAEMAEDQRAERPAQEAHGEHPEGGHQRGGGIVGGEELLAHDGGEVAVDAEVVPLHHIASEAGEHRPSLGLADLAVHHLGGVGDLAADQVHAPELADAGPDLLERARVQDPLEHAAGVGQSHQGHVLGVGDLVVEQQRQDAALAFQPLLAPLDRVAARLQHPEEGVILLAQDAAIAETRDGFAAQTHRPRHQPGDPVARRQPPGLGGDLGQHLVQHGGVGRGRIDHPEGMQIAVDTATDGQVHQGRAGEAAAQRGLGNTAEFAALVLQGQQQELFDQRDRRGFSWGGGRNGAGGARAGGHARRLSLPSGAAQRFRRKGGCR